MKFSYLGAERLKVCIWKTIGLFSIIFTSPFYILTFGSMFYISRSTRDYIVIPCLSILIVLFSLQLGSFFINYLPTIWVIDNQLFLSFFFFFRVKIKWSDIIDVTERENLGRVFLVRVKKITPLHIMYSSFYSATLTPGFLFTRKITDCEILLRTLKENAKQARFNYNH